MNNQNYFQPQQGYNNQPRQDLNYIPQGQGYNNQQYIPNTQLFGNNQQQQYYNPQPQNNQQFYNTQPQNNQLYYNQQQKPVQQQNNLAGRVISNIQDVKPNEITMDGSVCIFPMNDLSCIFTKAWGSDGSIHTVRFVPEQPVNTMSPQTDSEFSQIMNRLDNIEKIISKKYNNYQNKQSNQNVQKQEVENNG